VDRPRDYILDIQGLGLGDRGAAQPVSAGLRGRPWLSVYWKCCGVYSRIYRDRTGTRYVGICPRCGRQARAQVAPHGTHARFFEAW
jgi:hypothetical protein